MGILQAAAKKEETGPQCPSLFLGTMDKYRELKFLRRETDDSVKMYARGMLTWQDVAAYVQLSGQKISYFETELIMALDAIFEGKDDG